MALELVEAPLGVDDLATIADDEYRLALREGQLSEQHAFSALGHARRSGEALVEIQKHVPPTEWTEWLAQHFSGTARIANLYVRIVTYSDLTAEAQSIEHARKLVLGQPNTGNVRWARLPERVRVEARKLRRQGFSQRQIADELGVSQGLVSRWLNPALEKAQHERRRIRRRRERAAQEALRREEANRDVRKKGGDIAIAHEHLLKTEQALGRARTDLNLSADARAEIDEGFRDLNRLHDHIVRASRLS